MTFPSTSFDEIYASLDDLLSSERRRNASDLAQLEHLIARGWEPSTPADGEPDADVGIARSRSLAEQAEAPAPPAPPRVRLPERTTHGGYWGPKLVEKLTRIALERQGW